jgi:hypothetical protein
MYSDEEVERFNTEVERRAKKSKSKHLSFKNQLLVRFGSKYSDVENSLQQKILN